MDITALRVAASVTSAARPSLDLALHVAEATSDELLDAVIFARQIEARAVAAQLVLVAALHQRQVVQSGGASRSLDERSFTSEISAALTLSERAAQVLIGNARTLSDRLPATLAALSAGTISYRHALVLVDQTVGLDDDCLTVLEAQVLPFAPTMSAPRFAARARKARERLHPDTIDQRHVAALDTRSVSVEEDRDGMVFLVHKTDAATGLAIHDKLTTAAISLKKQGDVRSLAQLRSDILSAVMLATRKGAGQLGGDQLGAGQLGGGLREAMGMIPNLDDSEPFLQWFAGIKAEVVVTVPALALLGESDELATLEGYGPIDQGLARLLASRAPGFVRVLTHPETGATLSVGRRRYKIPKDLRMFLRLRDETCRFPNCNRRAGRCDIDHTREWHELGETNANNLAHLCRSDHTIKGSGKWKVAQSPDGSGELTWTSPMGRTYVTQPAAAI